MYALCGALLRLLDLALNQKVTTFGAQIFKKKKKKPKPPQNTSVSSLFISFSLSVEDSLHLFCPVLSYYLYLLFVSAFFLCWFYETALLTRQRSQCSATNEFLFLFRPRSVLCSVLTCSHSTQCCVLLWWDKLSVYHKMCVILSHVVKCWDARWFQDGLKTKTTLKELVLLRPGLSSLMWVYYVCVHGCMYACDLCVLTKAEL